MRKAALCLTMLVAGLSAGCKGDGSGAMSVDDIAATPPAGLTIKKLDTEDKTALDFLDPPGIEAGCTDAVHVVTNEGVSYGVYDYESEAVATMSMALWNAGNLGSPPFSFHATTSPFPSIGENAIFMVNDGAFTIVNRVGSRVVAVTSTEGRKVGAAAGIMTKALGGTVSTPAP